MQFGEIYLKIWGSTQAYVAFLTPEFHSCFFVFGGTCRHRILLHCTSQYLLCLVSIIFRWLIDAARLPCLAVKTQSGEGSVLMCGGSVCHNTLGPPVNPWTTGTVSRQFLLPVHCVKFVSVKPSVSLSVSLSL